MNLRWTTSNEYTTYSALYPERFGHTVAFAAEMTRLYPNGPEFWEEEINDCVKRQLEIGFPSVEKTLEVAKDRVLGLIESEVKKWFR